MPPRPTNAALRGAILYALAFAYAAIGITWMLVVSPKVPYADPWRFLGNYLTLPFPANAFTADNGHRELLPNLVRIAELHWLLANQWLQISVGTALVCGAVLLLLRTCRGGGLELRAAVTAIVCGCVFWLGNGRKLAHGNESVHLGLVLVCLVLGLRLLVTADRPAGPARAVGAAAAGLAATLSFGSGIACFGAFLAVLVLQRRWRECLPVALGSGAALAALLLCGDGERATFSIAAGEQVDLLLRWLGAPFVWALSPLLDPAHAGRMPWSVLREPMRFVADPVHGAFGPALAARWPALAFGGAGMLWLIAASVDQWRRRDTASAARLALGLAWFACVVGALVVGLRLQFFRAHPDQLTSQRYVPWSMLLWMGLLLAHVLRSGRSARAAAVVALALACTLAPSQVWTGRYAYKQLRTAELTALGAAVGALDREFPLVETDPADLERALPLLREAHAAMFAWPETPLLGTRPPPARLDEVAMLETVVEPVANRFAAEFGAASSRVQFRAAGAPPARLMLLLPDGTVAGLALRLPFDDTWHGWLRGNAPAAALRAAALR